MLREIRNVLGFDHPDTKLAVRGFFLLVAAVTVGQFLTACGSGGSGNELFVTNPAGPFPVEIWYEINMPREESGQEARQYRVELALYSGGADVETADPLERFPDIIGWSGDRLNNSMPPASKIRDRSYLVFGVMYDDRGVRVRQGFVTFRVSASGVVVPSRPTIRL